ncbi:MAG: carboxypeptidase-like regulatory domain-containing protein [Verrucomicrobiota bacterium]
MKPIEDTPVRSALLSCRVRIIPCLLAVLAGLAASLGFVPGLHQRVADEWQMARYNAGAGRFDTRVRFWGKVVDQDGKPLEGVNITVSVTTLRMIKTENGYREYEVLNATSAADGSFIFDGSDGMFLDIDALGKEGYVLPSAYQFGMSCEIGAKYRYQYVSIGGLEKVFTPNRSQPEIFHLWKIIKPEPLEICGNTPGLNGPEFMLGAPPERFSTISMMVTDVGTSQSPQWEVTVTALEPDGGVVQASSSDIFMFEAPEAGYARSIRLRYGPDGANQDLGDPGASFRFFVRSHSGRWHSATEFAFFAPKEDGTIQSRLRIWRNPSGSRNLEHDGGNPLRAISSTQ